MDKPQPHLLLVEDDIFLAGIYQKKFELEGYRLSLAADGETARRMAIKKQPALILLDILLHKLDGLAFLAALKAAPATANIPVIVLSNLGQKDEIERALKLGAADYLIKAHFKPSEVVRKVAEVLGIERGKK